MLYDMKGNLMEPENLIGDYCNKDEFNRCKVSFYNVLTLKICFDMIKLVTFTDDIKSVKDLRKYLIFSEVEKYGQGKLKEEKNDFRKYFRFTYNFDIINESIDLHDLLGGNKCSRQ